MTRLKALNPDQASGKTKELFSAINSKLGVVSNMIRTMGNSAPLLEGFLNFNGALGSGIIGAKTGELIALAVAEINACHYCLAAHTYMGKRFGKLDDETISTARLGISKDAKTAAILKFAKTLVNKNGHVNEGDVAAVKSAGVSEGEVAEIVGHVAINIFTNYFNNTANTEFDIPE